MMQNDLILSKVEKALSKTWGHPIQLLPLEQMDGHQQVRRLRIQNAPTNNLQSVILKQWRMKDDERFSTSSPSHFFNDWAGLEFLARVLNDEPAELSPLASSRSVDCDRPSQRGPLVPKIYAGDKNAGFLAMEDLDDTFPLEQALWYGSADQAAQSLRRYSHMLGHLHGKAMGQLDTYTQIRQKLSTSQAPQAQNYHNFFQLAVDLLETLGATVPPAAMADIHQSAQILTNSVEFMTFTHGDAVFSNIIERGGQWYLIDFEVGSFRHALWEGIYPRLLFPTSGLKYVLNIPQPVWLQAEAAYREILTQYCPSASDDELYGQGMTSACTCGALAFCLTWLEQCIQGEGPPEMINRIRQVALHRFDTFILTADEFDNMPHLADFFGDVAQKLRVQWPVEAHTLPYYPAFDGA